MKKRRVLAMVMATTLLSGSGFGILGVQAAEKTKTLKMEVEGYGYFGNFSVRVEEETGRVLGLEDIGPTLEDGSPLTGMSKNRWNHAWEGSRNLYDGKNLDEVEAVHVVDATSGATASGEAIKKGVLQALKETKDGENANPNYLQPISEKAPWDKEVHFSLQTEHPPANSNYQIAKEYVTRPGEQEREAYYAKERGEWKENTYILKKPLPGQIQRIVWRDKNGLYEDITTILEIEPSLKIEGGKLASETLDVLEFLKQVSRVEVKSDGSRYGDSYHIRSGEFVIRKDGYINEELKKRNGSPVFEEGKTYDLTIVSEQFGDVKLRYTATGNPLPKRQVEEGSVEIHPKEIELSERQTLKVDGSKVPEGDFKLVELYSPQGEKVPTQYQREGTYISLSSGSLIRPEVGTYVAILRDTTGLYEDVRVEVVVKNIFSIQKDQLLSSSEALTVPKYLEKAYGRYPKVKLREVGKEEITEFTIESEEDIKGSEKGLLTPDGKIRKDLMIGGEPFFSSEKTYEILIEKDGLQNPWISYHPEGIERVEEEEELERIPFDTVEKESEELFEGERKVEVEGVDGRIYRIKSYTQIDGKQVTSTTYSQETLVEKIDEVILIGTKKKPVEKEKQSEDGQGSEGGKQSEDGQGSEGGKQSEDGQGSEGGKQSEDGQGSEGGKQPEDGQGSEGGSQSKEDKVNEGKNQVEKEGKPTEKNLEDKRQEQNSAVKSEEKKTQKHSVESVRKEEKMQKVSKAPKTADQSLLLLYGISAMLSGSGLWILRKKKEK